MAFEGKVLATELAGVESSTSGGTCRPIQPHLSIEIDLRTFILSFVTALFAIILSFYIACLACIVKEKLTGRTMRAKNACNHGVRIPLHPEGFFCIMRTGNVFLHLFIKHLVDASELLTLFTHDNFD